MNTGLVVKLRKTQDAKAFTLTLIVLILGTILTGMGMAYVAVLPFLQPVHLLLAKHRLECSSCCC
jgi:cytochrome c oxidase assembly protein subunit 15